MERWIGKIRSWYQGTYVEPQNDPRSMFVFMTGTYRRHWTARCARVFVEFYLRHWQWVWGTIVALVAACLAAK